VNVVTHDIRFSIVWIDLEGSVHAIVKSEMCFSNCVLGVVGPSVSNNADFVSELFNGIFYKEAKLLPGHEVTFAGGSADNNALSTVVDLELNQLVIRLQVNLSIL
jgi:hypothetical protein